MPNFAIVDSHVHFFDPGAVRYAWLRGNARLDRRWTPEDFAPALRPVEVDKIVFVEAGADPGFSLQEAAWADGLKVAGVVAAVPLEKGAGAAADLDTLRRMTKLRGIRRLIQTEADPSFCLEPSFLDGVRLLARDRLPFDICVKHWALVYGVELARRCPAVVFVLDHIGKPDIRHGLMEPWRSTLRELANLPNVLCKISGVITEADHAAWREDDLRPYVEHAIECFGFDRIMFGSDWPVSEQTHAYADWVAILDRILAGSSPDELQRFWRRNAERTYRV